MEKAKDRANAAKAANARERNITQQYLNAGPSIGNLARAAYHWYNSVPWLGGQNESGYVYNIGEVPTPGVRTPEDIAKTGLTIRRGVQIAKERGITDDIVKGYNRLKSFLNSPGYRTRLKHYYKSKGSSAVIQDVAPEQRIGEQLYNIETAKTYVPKGEIINTNGSPMPTANGMYDPATHTIQVKHSRLKADTPIHEMIHARNRGSAYLDNSKYKMRTRAEIRLNKELAEGNIMRNSPKANALTDDAKYYGDVVEQEPRVLNTVAAMEREGYDINNLSDEQIYNYLYNRPIDTHGSDTQSLIDNYVMEDIPNAIRNFKNIAAPIILTDAGYRIGKHYRNEQRPQHRNGGSIHIAPSKRDTFTAAKLKYKEGGIIKALEGTKFGNFLNNYGSTIVGGILLLQLLNKLKSAFDSYLKNKYNPNNLVNTDDVILKTNLYLLTLKELNPDVNYGEVDFLNIYLNIYNSELNKAKQQSLKLQELNEFILNNSNLKMDVFSNILESGLGLVGKYLTSNNKSSTKSITNTSNYKLDSFWTNPTLNTKRATS